MGRTIIVSNRLPVTAIRNSRGDWDFTQSSGGLVSALAGLRSDMEFLWVGWLGQPINESEQLSIEKTLLEKHSAVPVFIPDHLADLYYDKFSNSVLWPLLHYLPGETEFEEKSWEAYLEVNLKFSEVLERLELEKNDTIWIHDYHLMCLPRLIRLKYGADVKIGFFLHTPFPSSEIFRVLPVRKEVLLGLVDSDLIGFHSFDYARHFASTCANVLSASFEPDGLMTVDGRMVSLGTFPIGIDPSNFIKGGTDEKVKTRLKEIEQRFFGKKIIIGVDRLDYIKGIPNKLVAFQRFLEKYPEYREEVVLVQVAVPSRVNVQEYRDLRGLIYELAGRCNGVYGSSDFSPLQLINRSIDHDELSALYQIADSCLITSIRDGMNLVSYEYVASQSERHGVLILSEFTGAAHSLSGALLVNPWNAEEVCDSIYQALTMEAAEKEQNQNNLLDYVCKQTSTFWGQSFLQALQSLKNNVKPGLSNCHLMKKKNVIAFVEENCCHLVEAGIDCFQIVDQIPNKLQSTSHGFLKSDGSIYKKSDCEEWIQNFPTIESSWIEIATAHCKFFVDRIPGTSLKISQSTLTWKFEFGDESFWKFQADELKASLLTILSSFAVKVTVEFNELRISPLVNPMSIFIKKLKEDTDLQVVLFVGLNPEHEHIKTLFKQECDIVCSFDSPLDSPIGIEAVIQQLRNSN